MLNVIIFSLNRPAQLDLFIRSAEKFFKNFYKNNITIIYKYSNDLFKKGYEKVIARYPEIKFILETILKQDILKSFDFTKRFTVFFTDDDVFINDFNFDTNDFGFNFNNINVKNNFICISLRMNPSINYCYTQNIKVDIPNIIFLNDKSIIWKWRAEKYDWGYPMSLDGHIFLTNDIFPLIKTLEFENPNYLEGKLSKNPINKPFMICYKNSKIINNDVNRVNKVSPNKFGEKYNFPVDLINDNYLSGKIISLENFINLKNESPHIEVPLIFIKEYRMITNHFTIIVPIYNGEKWIERCLKSILIQDYKNYSVIIINDGSTDNTKSIIENFIKNNNLNNFLLHNFQINYGSGLFSIDTAIKMIENEDSICITVDGDDYLSNNTVFSYINQIYQDVDVWMTYGNMEASDKKWSKILQEVKDIEGYRAKRPFTWQFSHLRTFRKKLYDHINKNDFFNPETETYYKRAWDVAFMVPAAELSGYNHIKFINEILYIYNNENPNSDFKTNPKLQTETTEKILARKPYKKLEKL